MFVNCVERAFEMRPVLVKVLLIFILKEKERNLAVDNE